MILVIFTCPNSTEFSEDPELERRNSLGFVPSGRLKQITSPSYGTLFKLSCLIL